jgi:three-Cys-motif partner protein
VSTKDFFKEKKEWSKFKDGLLGYYLKLYFQKIMATKRETVYIDCFAGRGFFEDGEKGSPIIAYEIARKATERSKVTNKGIMCVFIEPNYAKDLLHFTDGYDNCIVIEDRYQNVIKPLIPMLENRNVFLYIDPFGVKDLHFENYDAVCCKGIKSIELLLNFNANGFIREGKRLLDANIHDTNDDTDNNSIENMNNVANGTYWHDIIASYSRKEISWNIAEELMTDKYVEQLRTKFRYVMQIPIREKLNNIPKYRLIYATNYAVGYIEMASSMNKKWKEMKDLITRGQKSLFQMDTNNRYTKYSIEEKINLILNNGFITYQKVLVQYYNSYGPSDTYSDINQAIKKMEKDKSIIISRNPSTTETGKKAGWIDFKMQKKKMWVKKSG